MVMANNERIARALDLLRDGLRPRCEQTWEAFYGDDWLETVNQQFHNPERSPTTEDIAFLFKGLKVTWNEVFSQGFPPGIRSLVFELSDVRNTWAHQGSFSSDDVLRALDSMERVLEAFGDVDNRKKILSLRRDLMRQMFDEESRAERRKTAAKPTEGQPQSGLTPWRDLITPHEDVASGRFAQAEFAADLSQVADGKADDEYQDPRQFFARTYMTSGLRDLLVDAARRLCGSGGSPVIELQTNFGGGKTHSMIALYHLASGVDPATLPGLADLLDEHDLVLPETINRAVLVGQAISPAKPVVVDDDVSLHTLWGHLAWQLGGRDAYELVRADDEAGTVHKRALIEVFERSGPAIVLVDEWVAYVRQLREAGDGPRVAGGDFGTQFTFAQALTEAAAAVPNVVVLVSLPESEIEVGGEHGRKALVELKNHVSRLATEWSAASPDESFEIVRRRLFEPISPENARVRDGVIRAFAEMYRKDRGTFPSGCGEDDYRRRMELSYPIHPELFDRLFEDWSSIDKFQRTRGVLRLMALVIAELWQRGDQSLLIMPGNLPMDSGPVASELKKYLEDGWDAVIQSNVDGENALPLRLDRENPHFGRLSATRRVARTVYMGSAPRPDSAKGVDIKSIVLGCVQPGEPARQFEDALRRLSNEATHLHNNGNQYWYSLTPTLSRIAADRANSNYNDLDADQEIHARIQAQRDHGNFAGGVQVFAEGPGDVPDDDIGARLVILTPSAAHAGSGKASPAIELAERILAQREGGPRLNRNLVVFVAAAQARVDELRAAARLHLAWESILRDRGDLDLKDSQVAQAESKIEETSQTLDARINETFTQVLVPGQQPGTPDIQWTTVRAAGSGGIAARVSQKLASEELLIATYSGVRVKMDIDRYDLWSDRHDIEVRELWASYCRYPHMSRLASFDTLAAAISDGTANLNWAKETFGYAEAHDGDTWVGVVTGAHVTPKRSGLLIHPDHVPERAAPDEAGEDAGEIAGAAAAGAEDVPAGAGEVTGAGAGAAQDFYALFELDPVRGIKQLGEILEHVTARLGPDVHLSLEVRAHNDDGYDDGTRRIVQENANNLGATAAEFE